MTLAPVVAVKNTSIVARVKRRREQLLYIATPTAEEFSKLIALFNARRYVELESQVRVLLTTYPSAHFAWQLLGGAMQMQGKDALPAFQKTAELSPDDANAHFNLGVAFKSAGRLDQAADSYRRAVTLKPNYIEALTNLGGVLQDLGQLDEAVQCYRRALLIQPNVADTHNKLGTVLKVLGKFSDAVDCYRQALQINPNFADAYYNLGNALKDAGQFEDAVANYLQVVRIKPNFAEAHSNLGSVYMKLGNTKEALAHYQTAIQIDPANAEAHYNAGIALGVMEQFNQAVTSYLLAIQHKPDFVDAYNNLGFMLRQQGKFDESVAVFRKAIATNPDHADVYGNLGAVLKIQGKLDEALFCYQRQFFLDPDNLAAQHHIASITGENTERAPMQYVESLFDKFAGNFDTQLVQKLKYDIPEKLVMKVLQHATPPAEKWNILDLGCGTGLAGDAISAFSRQLVGVDLSAKMLAKARERNIYQRLERSDLLAMMQGEKDASYDVVIAADVFVYLGRLDEIMSEIKRLLVPNGIFAFSVEALEVLPNEAVSQGSAAAYQLENTGRYSHAANYLIELAAANSFLPQEMMPTQIRMERGNPVNGYLVLWKS